MQQKPSAITTLRIVYFAMLIGMILFAGVIWFVSQDQQVSIDKDYHRTLLIVVLFLAAGALGLSRFLFSKDIAAIQQMNDLTSKMNYYRAAAIKRFAFTEGPFFFAVIAFFITHEQTLMIVAGVLFVVYLSLYPSSTKIASQINESATDIEQLQA